MVLPPLLQQVQVECVSTFNESVLPWKMAEPSGIVEGAVRCRGSVTKVEHVRLNSIKGSYMQFYCTSCFIDCQVIQAVRATLAAWLGWTA